MALITRRQLIGAGAGVWLAGPSLSLPARGLTIQPRSAWGANHPPKGPLETEDVRFLIVHHSASRNGHTSEDAPAILRSWFSYHTGPDKGWNDIAYNFVIDSEGVIWEGRQGSLDGPVAGDATGGNQGFTQLVCVIGDYNTAHPTKSSLDSLVRLLAWLADRHGISTTSGSEVAFTSRGSNKWPQGTMVTTPTITGHRAMSKTTCPGENLNGYVTGALMSDVQTVREGGVPTLVATPATQTPPTTAAASTTTSATVDSTTSTSSTAPASTSTTSTTSTTVSSASTPGPTTTAPVSSTAPAQTFVESAPTTTQPVASGPAVDDGTNPLLVGAGAMVALGSGLLIWRYNRLKG